MALIDRSNYLLKFVEAKDQFFDANE